MAINPTFLALSAANPGLLPLAFGGGGGGGPEGGLSKRTFVVICVIALILMGVVGWVAFGLWGLLVVPLLVMEACWTALWCWVFVRLYDTDFDGLVMVALMGCGIFAALMAATGLIAVFGTAAAYFVAMLDVLFY